MQTAGLVTESQEAGHRHGYERSWSAIIFNPPRSMLKRVVPICECCGVHLREGTDECFTLTGGMEVMPCRVYRDQWEGYLA